MRKKHLRILSYNIHKGFSLGNRRFVLGKIRELSEKSMPTSSSSKKCKANTKDIVPA